MPMTPAERQRKYRERLKENDLEKYEEMRIKNLERIKSKYVKVCRLSENEKNKRRSDWRRLKKNQEENKKKNFEGNEKKIKSRKRYLHYYYKLKNTIDKQQKKIDIQRKKIAALKKRLYRQKMLCLFQKPDNSETLDENVTVTEMTPNSKCNSFIQELSTISAQDKEKVKRVLLDHTILTESIAKQYINSKSNTEKNIIKRICTSTLAHRYKVCTRLGYSTGLKGRIRFRQKNLVSKRIQTAKKIREFFNQDDVSRPSAGKKETKTLKGKKKQKRYLLDTLKSLHKKYRSDTGSTISYATFTKYKPFYVVRPRLADRNTCVCKMHANMEMTFIALKKLNVLKSYNKIDELVKSTVCDIASKECMYSECEICKEVSIDYDFSQTYQESSVSWLEWSSERVEYNKGGETKTAKRFLPVLREGKLKDLILVTEVQLKKFKEHLFNIRHQYKTYKYVKDNLTDDEIVIHCDFSENYTCKMHEEIQAVHFGASQYQISLHTSVAYKKNEKPKSYCTLSDSTKHSPEAIWAHLKPVLVDLKRMHPQVKTLHVYSDGPTTQYKQKKNFFLFKIFIDELGFEKGTWNFSESYHGKGPADGVGANIKRLLDEKVSHGKNVLNAVGAFSLLEDETRVKLFCINEYDINVIETNHENAFSFLLAVPNTLRIHQIQAFNDDTHDIYYRILSCCCNSSMMRGFCDCFSLKKHCLIKQPRKNRRRLLYSPDTDEDIFVLDKSPIRIGVQANFETEYNFPATVEHPSGFTSSTQINKVMRSTLKNTINNDTQLFFPAPGPAMSANEKFDLSPGPSKRPRQSSSDSLDFFNQKPEPVKNRVTILSDIKVSWSSEELRNMLKGSSRYNISSNAIQSDFPELNKNKEAHSTTEKEDNTFFLSKKKNFSFFSSSDSEN